MQAERRRLVLRPGFELGNWRGGLPKSKVLGGAGQNGIQDCAGRNVRHACTFLAASAWATSCCVNTASRSERSIARPESIATSAMATPSAIDDAAPAA